MVDSGAFTELEKHGAYRHEPIEYARELKRIHANGVARIDVAVAQDFMCEPFMLAKTGLAVCDHQRLTVERYDRLCLEMDLVFNMDWPFPIMPVLQGYSVEDYLRHLKDYGIRLTTGMWVGVGSVCKRQGDPALILAILRAIKDERPDLKLHGFGVKTTALQHRAIRKLLHTADSMAWSAAARRRKVGSANDWRQAKSFQQQIYSYEEAL